MSPPGDARRPTIYDVATAAGVSKSLVSLVLQGSPNVSDARRQAVRDAMARLHYRPSRAAATLAGTRTRTVGVLIDDYRNLWFVELLRGLQDVLGPLGFRVAVEDLTTGNPAHPGQVGTSPLDGFLALEVDGIVVATEPSAAMTSTLGTPVVVVGSREHTLPGADVVANDDRRGGALATRHLLDLGHRRIGHLTGAGGSARARAAGYADAMREAGVEALVGGVGGTDEHDGWVAAGRLLDAHPDVTAVFAGNDTMAFGALAAARQRGRRVPEDLSLVGYDNSPLASAHLLRLTTVDDRGLEVGGATARALLARMEAGPGSPTAGEPTLITPTLVTRSSSAPPG